MTSLPPMWTFRWPPRLRSRRLPRPREPLASQRACTSRWTPASGRNGFTLAQIDSAIDLLLSLVDERVFEIVGQWSHLAVADAPAVGEFVEKTDEQIRVFEEFTSRLHARGIEPRIRHLANTAATLSRPEIHYV